MSARKNMSVVVKGTLIAPLTLRANNLSHSSVSPQAWEANATLKAHHFLDLVMFSRPNGSWSYQKDGAAEAPKITRPVRHATAADGRKQRRVNNAKEYIPWQSSVSAFANLSQHGHPPSLTTRTCSKFGCSEFKQRKTPYAKSENGPLADLSVQSVALAFDFGAATTYYCFGLNVSSTADVSLLNTVDITASSSQHLHPKVSTHALRHRIDGYSHGVAYAMQLYFNNQAIHQHSKGIGSRLFRCLSKPNRPFFGISGYNSMDVHRVLER
ncbi:hypothetical protein PAAG_11248 [Paracoccidioides lutzii Pb01]|uniref:Uncharacterized protein n=1 Tax=Paracoccidioides lutzii (strain ATCC MYA-826 / Pb01) TaxID=502779 RepID=A0A0A2V6V4_PARBA|nr:hypothetical protein PAAG_11248 [Paracoccidioides lutzii Pb01]KGQ02067.1 hypothetical protein PAAG_11248 [Paracoccidioides lutzii Pb01]